MDNIYYIDSVSLEYNWLPTLSNELKTNWVPESFTSSFGQIPVIIEDGSSGNFLLDNFHKLYKEDIHKNLFQEGVLTLPVNTSTWSVVNIQVPANITKALTASISFLEKASQHIDNYYAGVAIIKKIKTLIEAYENNNHLNIPKIYLIISDRSIYFYNVSLNKKFILAKLTRLTKKTDTTDRSIFTINLDTLTLLGTNDPTFYNEIKEFIFDIWFRNWSIISYKATIPENIRKTDKTFRHINILPKIVKTTVMIDGEPKQVKVMTITEQKTKKIWKVNYYFKNYSSSSISWLNLEAKLALKEIRTIIQRLVEIRQEKQKKKELKEKYK